MAGSGGVFIAEDGSALAEAGPPCGSPTRGTEEVLLMKVGSEIMFLLTVMRRREPGAGAGTSDDAAAAVDCD